MSMSARLYSQKFFYTYHGKENSKEGKERWQEAKISFSLLKIPPRTRGDLLLFYFSFYLALRGAFF